MCVCVCVRERERGGGSGGAKKKEGRREHFCLCSILQPCCWTMAAVIYNPTRCGENLRGCDGESLHQSSTSCKTAYLAKLTSIKQVQGFARHAERVTCCVFTLRLSVFVQASCTK